MQKEDKCDHLFAFRLCNIAINRKSVKHGYAIEFLLVLRDYFLQILEQLFHLPKSIEVAGHVACKNVDIFVQNRLTDFELQACLVSFL